MRLGLRSLLVALAVILFILSVLIDENAFDFLAFGLAAVAASFIVDDFVGGSFGRDNR